VTPLQEQGTARVSVAANGFAGQPARQELIVLLESVDLPPFLRFFLTRQSCGRVGEVPFEKRVVVAVEDELVPAPLDLAGGDASREALPVAARELEDAVAGDGKFRAEHVVVKTSERHGRDAGRCAREVGDRHVSPAVEQQALLIARRGGRCDVARDRYDLCRIESVRSDGE
jgi:hypothetical protein